MKYKIFISRFLFLIPLHVLLFSFSVSRGYTETAEQLIKQGNTAVEAQKTDEAEKYFSKAIALEPQNADAHFRLGTLWMNKAIQYQDKELLSKAMEECKAALQIQPLMGEAHDNLAYCYYILKDYQRSKIHYKKALAQGVKDEFLKERLNVTLKGEKRSKVPVTENSPPKSESKTEPKKTPPSSSDDELGGGLLE